MSDGSTFSNYTKIHSTHVDLTWTVDWDSRIVSGTATHTVVADEPTSEFVVDALHLDISAVHLGTRALAVSTVQGEPPLGQAVSVKLPEALSAGDSAKVTFTYATTEKCTALGWLNAEQTESKKEPFLFSQCQPTHARSLIPLQDTPARKVTYTAAVTSRNTVLMSALFKGADRGVYYFDQPEAIPSYLIALAGGDLVFEPLGERTGVWAEREAVKQAKWEFAHVERQIKTIEDITGVPYAWGRYDLLVLPASFPYGGMENANMTFVTPALLVGDRSETGVVSHEAAHSWFGNLVGCADWDSFWLNEGWTTYTERLVSYFMESGTPARDFDYLLGTRLLNEDLARLPPRFRSLHVKYARGEDPDEGYSSIPYEKGSTFIYYLERVAGGFSVFQPYVTAYVQQFRGKAISTDQWYAHFWQFWDAHDPAVARKFRTHVDFDAWLHGRAVDLPAELALDTSLVDRSVGLARKWIDAVPGAYPKPDSLAGFSSAQQAYVLDVLIKHGETNAPLPPSTISALDAAYAFSSSTNAELLFRWFSLALISGASAHAAAIWVRSQGRMKYVRPLYRKLNAVDRALAVSTFENYGRAFLHPIAVRMVSLDLGL